MFAMLIVLFVLLAIEHNRKPRSRRIATRQPLPQVQRCSRSEFTANEHLSAVFYVGNDNKIHRA